MKFGDFLLKRTLNNDDFLVGCDSNGKYFRISVQDLRSTLGVTKVKAESVIIQYSINGNLWHSTFTEGDRYMRVKCGSGEWSDAICISVSAYETWKEQNGGNGTVEEFLLSLHGKDVDPVDVSKLKLSEMDGYNDFLTNIDSSISNTMSGYQDAIAKKIAAFENQLKALTASERIVIPLSGEQNGKNVTFSASNTFVSGTSQLFINGKRYVAGSDYLEVEGTKIILLTHVPLEKDVIVFIGASVKADSSVSESAKE